METLENQDDDDEDMTWSQNRRRPIIPTCYSKFLFRVAAAWARYRSGISYSAYPHPALSLALRNGEHKHGYRSFCKGIRAISNCTVHEAGPDSCARTWQSDIRATDSWELSKLAASQWKENTILSILYNRPCAYLEKQAFRWSHWASKVLEGIYFNIQTL